MGIKTTALNKLENVRERGGAVVLKHHYRTNGRWMDLVRYYEHTPQSMCDCAITAHLLHQLLHKSRRLSNMVWQTPPGDWTVAGFESEIYSRLKLCLGILSCCCNQRLQGLYIIKINKTVSFINSEWLITTSGKHLLMERRDGSTESEKIQFQGNNPTSCTSLLG